MISKLQSREFIRQAIAERIGELKDELFHWVGELERLDAACDHPPETESQPSESTDGADGSVMLIGGR